MAITNRFATEDYVKSAIAEEQLPVDSSLNLESTNPIQNKAVTQVVNNFETILDEQVLPQLLPKIHPNNDIYYILRVNGSGTGCEWVNIASDMYIQTWVRPYLLQAYPQKEDEGKVMQVVNGQWKLSDPINNINTAIGNIGNNLSQCLGEVQQLKAPKTEFVLNSSTAGSAKQFKLTIDDNGTLTISEMIKEV